MHSRLGMVGMLGLALLALSACDRNRTPELMNLHSTTRGPDEFGILPTKPLQIPQDLAALPAPTPGGSNITDPTPEADAIAALGGNAAVLARPSTDGALVAQASRFGVSADIRSVLAAEDLDYRRLNNGKLLERVFNVTIYFKAYLAQSLNQQAELARFRALGVRTNSAPPPAVAN